MLYLIPTILAPDTSDSVLSPQIKEVISETDHFFVENLRTARRFISELKLGKVIENLHFYEVDKDTSSEKILDYFKEIPVLRSRLSRSCRPWGCCSENRTSVRN
jgi:16S rRNA (cytidine1402-2'-O)-methyltransferase